MKKNKTLIATFIASQVLSFYAKALPDPLRGDVLSKYGIVNNTNIPVIGDSENYNLVYLAPQNNQKIIGSYQNLASTIDCTSLRDVQNRFYASPKDDAEFAEAVSNGRPVSPYFDYTVGFGMYHMDKLSYLANAKLKTTKFIEEHKEIYGKYVSDKEKYEALSDKMKELSGNELAAQSSFFSKINALNMDHNLSQQDKNKQYDQFQSEYQRQLNQILSEKLVVQDKFLAAQSEYFKSKRAWAPYADQLEWLVKVEQSVSESLENLYALSKTHYEDGLKVLKATERRVVGLATSAYNIYSNEQSQIGNLITNSGVNLSTQQLPIFNISFNSGYSKFVLDSNDAIGGALPGYNQVVISVPSDAVRAYGGKISQLSSFADSSGKPGTLSVLMGDYLENMASSGFFEMPVTQGAYCGTPIEKEVSYTYTDDQKEKTKYNYRTKTYNNPAPNQAVFIQDVALRYSYVAKAEKLEGSCTMNVKQMSDYWRSSGRQSSWSLFGGSRSHSWDDTRETLNKRMGLSCHIKNRPQGSNPAEWSEKEIQLEKNLYADMFAMFVIENAKSFSVEKKEPKVSEGPHPFASAGGAVMNLCGSTTTECAVTGIVLKTLDEMTGGRATGSTSAVINYDQTITKDYSIDGYFIANGATAIEMKVCVDQHKCN